MLEELSRPYSSLQRLVVSINAADKTRMAQTARWRTKPTAQARRVLQVTPMNWCWMTRRLRRHLYLHDNWIGQKRNFPLLMNYAKPSFEAIGEPSRRCSATACRKDLIIMVHRPTCAATLTQR